MRNFAVKPAPWLGLAIAVLAFAILSILFLYAAPRGISSSDEYFYLVWIDHPKAYDLGYQPFGYVLNPLFELLGRSIVRLRIAGYLMSIGAGACLAYAANQFFSTRYPDRFASSRGLVILGAVCGFGNYALWLLTPAYNLLANVGLALFIAGCLGWLDNRKAASLLVAFGGYLSFFGKPPLALVEIAIALLVLVKCDARWGKLLLAGAVAGALFLLTIAGWDDPVGFFKRMIETQHILGMGNQWWELPRKVASEIYHGPPLFIVAATVIAIALALPPTVTVPRNLVRMLLVACLAWLALKIAFAAPYSARVHLLGLLTICIGMLYLVLRSEAIPRPAQYFCLAILLAPFLVSMGTYDDINDHLTFHLMFPLFAIVLIAQFKPRDDVATIGLAGGFTLLMLFLSTRPFEINESIYRQREPLSLRLFSDPILVDGGMARWATAMRDIGRSNGITADTPIVDFNGTVPINAAFLGGKAPVLPWLFYATPGWTDIVWSRMTEQERASAWLITPIAPGFEGTALVKQIRHNAGRYELIGTAPFPMGKDVIALKVWKPKAKDEAHPMR